MLSSCSNPSDPSRPFARLERAKRPGGSAEQSLPADESGIAAERDDALVCATCAHPITSERARIERFGGHVHERVNLAGVAFQIGLFERAPGARLVGESSGEFPFFPHHLWTIAVCRGCFSHLGWRFMSGGEVPFYGLSLTALVARNL